MALSTAVPSEDEVKNCVRREVFSTPLALLSFFPRGGTHLPVLLAPLS